MDKTLRTFLQRVPDYSDRDLITVSIYDAALFTPSELGFDFLTNKIFTELVKRDLPLSRASEAKRLVKRLSKEGSSEDRRIAAIGPIRWEAPTYDDLMSISKLLNNYDYRAYVEFIISSDHKPILPESYYWGNNNVLHHFSDDSSDIEDVYPGIITITRIFLDKDCNSNIPQKAEVSFMCEGQEKLRRMNLKDLYNPNSVLLLANDGAFVNSENAKYLARYFFDYIRTFRTDIEHIYLTRQIGWQNKEYKEFVPYKSDCEYDHSEYRKEYLSIIHSQGDYKEWATLINPFRDNNHIPFRIILATSFASVLAEPLMHQPFFLNIHGRSQLGKTPSLMVVASPWANPDRKSGYIGRYHNICPYERTQEAYARL